MNDNRRFLARMRLSRAEKGLKGARLFECSEDGLTLIGEAKLRPVSRVKPLPTPKEKPAKKKAVAKAVKRTVRRSLRVALVIPDAVQPECLPKFTASQVRKVPQQRGVYFLFYKGEITYIGSSENLFRRLSTHEIISVVSRLPDVGSTAIKFSFLLVRKDQDLLALEYALIQRIKPCMNRKDNPWDTALLRKQRQRRKAS